MPKQDLLASVVITNYNYAPYLRDAIESALDQTYAPAEVIVVDDGSTDDSRRVIAEYGSRIIPVLKANGGMGSAHNAGFAASRADVVLFLDSDDFLVATALERAVPYFEDPDVVKVHGPVWEVDRRGVRTGRLIPERLLPEGDLRDAVIKGGPDACACAPIHGNVWARRFLADVLPMPEEHFRRHSDMYLMMLAPLYGKLRRLAEPLGCYRMHGGNDYACRPVDEKNRRNLELYDCRCLMLAERLQRMGVEFDAEAWKKGAGYQWMHRLHTATEELKAIIPSGETLVLVDEAQWLSPWGESGVISGRRTLPLVEREGQYWGRPEDDATALSELARLRESGAGWLVVAWPAFWWLDYYTGLFKHLRSRFRCLLENERLVIFDLRSPLEGSLAETGPQAGPFRAGCAAWTGRSQFIGRAALDSAIQRRSKTCNLWLRQIRRYRDSTCRRSSG